MKYKSIVVTRRGGPEVMQIKENDVHEPAAGQVRIKVLATGVGRTDINYRYGYSPFSPKVPFVPGYEVAGVIDAIGGEKPPINSDGTRLTIGDRVAALTGQGGYAEMIYLNQEDLVSVPTSLKPEDIVVLVLNYVTAYQMIHRVAKVKKGDRVLIIGASGGVGTALLQLGQLGGLKMYGTSSPEKSATLVEFGATPVDYHTQDFSEVIKREEPTGIDFVFDGVGGNSGDRGLEILRRGGKLIGYAPPTGVLSLLAGLIKIAFTNLMPNGKSIEFYGISALYMRDKNPFKNDLQILFKLLEDGKIKPLIDKKLPLMEAIQANALLESGKVNGNIVLLSPELI